MRKSLQLDRLTGSFLRLVALLILTFLLLASRIYAAGTWASLKAPEGGSILALAVDPQNPSTVYAGTQGGGVYKSTDGGTSWSAINNGLGMGTVGVLAIDPQNPAVVYAGSGEYYGGIYKTTNASGSTVQLSATPNGGYTFSAWSGSLVGTGNPRSIIMSAPRIVTANFRTAGTTPSRLPPYYSRPRVLVDRRYPRRYQD